MSSHPQLSLTLRDARWRPLADTDGVKWALDLSSEEVEALEGVYLVAFNIAVNLNPGDGSKHDPRSRRCMRYLTRSIEHFKATGGKLPFHSPWPETFKLIIPHDKPILHGTEMDTALNCDPDHRLNLIRAGLLKTVDGTSWRPGRNGAPCVTRASFEDFLKGRQL